MDKKFVYIISTIAVCFMFTGCGHEHTWVEATCIEPKTCSECGETEGEPLGHTWVDATCAEAKHCSVCGETESEPLEHTWVDATCAEAKHCSVCGETEGEPLEHTLTEANYQQPATCEVCGETVGEPLQAYFEKYGISCDAELNTEYVLTVFCSESEELTSEAHVVFSDYEVFESDKNHEALDGYEWRAVTCKVTASDENAQEFGVSTSSLAGSYYDDDTFADSYDEEKGTYSLNYNGIDYTEVKINFEELGGGWDIPTHTYTYQPRIYIRVPKGYDGIVALIYSTGTEEWNYLREIENPNEHAIGFRLK